MSSPKSPTLSSQDPVYEQAYRRARHQVRRMRGWYIHALVFTVIVGFAWLRYLFGDALVPWGHGLRAARMPLAMTVFWGLGLSIHWLVTFGRLAHRGPLSRDWEERQIQRLMDSDPKAKATPEPW